MKVFMIASFGDGSGYSSAAIDYARSLLSAGLDLAIRPLKWNSHKAPLHPDLLPCLTKDPAGADFVIQYGLPHLMEPTDKAINVAMFDWETSKLPSQWAKRLREFQVIIVPNKQMLEAVATHNPELLKTSYVTVIPHAHDVEKYERNYPPLPQLKPHRERGTHLFYTICEYSRRKNLADLLKSYYLEFSAYDNVHLLVKTYRTGVGDDALMDEVLKFDQGIIDGLRLNRKALPLTTYITQYLTDEEINRLHLSCNTFVQTSFGEGWSIPAFDAMAFGRTPIVPASTGYLSYVSEGAGKLIPVSVEPCFGMNDSIPDLYAGSQEWWRVSVPHFRAAMREALRGKSSRATAGLETAYQFTHSIVGSRIRKVLEHAKAQQVSLKTRSGA